MTYRYDIAGRLIELINENGASTRFQYDALGRRIGKRLVREHRDGSPAEQEQHWYGWDGDRLITEQSDERVVSTVYEPDSFVPLIRVDTTREEVQGQLQARKELFFYHCNHLGTPEVLIEQRNGQIA